MIPAEAAEAAARVIQGLREAHRTAEEIAAFALEAAAPHMLADPEAWHEGYEAGYNKAVQDSPAILADLNEPEPVLAEPSLTRTLKVETYDGSTVDARVTILPAVIVASEEQLNELPAGSVVLSVETLHHEGGWPIAYQRWQDGDWHRGGRASSTHPDNFLPATVLHRPTP